MPRGVAVWLMIPLIACKPERPLPFGGGSGDDTASEDSSGADDSGGAADTADTGGPGGIAGDPADCSVRSHYDFQRDGSVEVWVESTYDSDGAPLSMTMGSGTEVEVFEYWQNEDGRPVAFIKDEGFDGHIDRSEAYGWGKWGIIHAFADIDGDGINPPTEEWVYLYDEEGALTVMEVTDEVLGPQFSWDYSYEDGTEAGTTLRSGSYDALQDGSIDATEMRTTQGDHSGLVVYEVADGNADGLADVETTYTYDGELLEVETKLRYVGGHLDSVQYSEFSYEEGLVTLQLIDVDDDGAWDAERTWTWTCP